MPRRPPSTPLHERNLIATFDELDRHEERWRIYRRVDIEPRPGFERLVVVATRYYPDKQPTDRYFHMLWEPEKKRLAYARGIERRYIGKVVLLWAIEVCTNSPIFAEPFVVPPKRKRRWRKKPPAPKAPPIRYSTIDLDEQELLDERRGLRLYRRTDVPEHPTYVSLILVAEAGRHRRFHLSWDTKRRKLLCKGALSRALNPKRRHWAREACLRTLSR